MYYKVSIKNNGNVRRGHAESGADLYVNLDSGIVIHIEGKHPIQSYHLGSMPGDGTFTIQFTEGFKKYSEEEIFGVKKEVKETKEQVVQPKKKVTKKKAGSKK